MKESILRQRGALRRAVVRSVIVVAMCAFASPFAVSAQATTTPERPPSAQTKNVHPRVLLMPQAHYGAPLRSAAGGAVLVAIRPWTCEDGWCGAPGVEVQAMTGNGGWRIGGGVGWRCVGRSIRRRTACSAPS